MFELIVRAVFPPYSRPLEHLSQVMMSGSAPIQPHVIQWFRAVLGTTIVEGYGQTETSAATSAYLMGDTVPGTCSTIYLVPCI